MYIYSEARRVELRLLSEASFPVLYHYSEARRAELRLLSVASFLVLYHYSEARRAELLYSAKRASQFYTTIQFAHLRVW